MCEETCSFIIIDYFFCMSTCRIGIIGYSVICDVSIWVIIAWGLLWQALTYINAGFAYFLSYSTRVLFAFRAFYLIVATVIGLVVSRAQRRGFRLLFLQTKDVQIAKEKSWDLLVSLLPAFLVKRMLASSTNSAIIADSYDNISFLQSDIKGFTSLSKALDPNVVVAFLNRMFSAFDKELADMAVLKMYTVGDAFIACTGVPTTAKLHATALTLYALRMQEEMIHVNQLNAQTGAPEFSIRIGVSTGSAITGIVGADKPSYLAWGPALEQAEVMEQNGEIGKVRISSSTWSEIGKEGMQACFEILPVHDDHDGFFVKLSEQYKSTREVTFSKDVVEA